MKTMLGLRGVVCTNSFGAGGDAQPAKMAVIARNKKARLASQSDMKTPFFFEETVYEQGEQTRIPGQPKTEWEVVSD
jgi:hypothetical protein